MGNLQHPSSSSEQNLLSLWLCGVADARFRMWPGVETTRRIWEFLGVSDGSVCVSAMHEEEHSSLKFKAVLT